MSCLAPIVPDNSPFSPAQRAWLNGLLAGLVVRGQRGAAPPAAAAGVTSPQKIQAASARFARSAPLPARFDGALRLSREGSEKDIRHVVFRHQDLSLGYKVGDALGVHVANEPEIVAAIIERLAVPAACEVDCPDGTRRPLREALLEACDIGRPSDRALAVLASRARDPGEADRLQPLPEGYPGPH